MFRLQVPISQGVRWTFNGTFVHDSLHPGISIGSNGGLRQHIILGYFFYDLDFQHFKCGASKHRPLHLSRIWRQIQPDLRYFGIMVCFYIMVQRRDFVVGSRANNSKKTARGGETADRGCEKGLKSRLKVLLFKGSGGLQP